MNSKRSKKVLRSKSPGSMNKMFHSHMTPNKKMSANKLVVSKKSAMKSPSKLNISKISKSSTKSIGKSRSTHSLPRIPGNDLKIIKEIFTKAKKYKMKYGQQKIPMKVIVTEKCIKKVPVKGSRSIPKYKNSSNTVNAMNYYNIGKLPSLSYAYTNAGF